MTNPLEKAYHSYRQHLSRSISSPPNIQHLSPYSISLAIHAQASASANLSDMLSFTFLSVRLLWAEITCVKLSTAEIKFILELLK